MRGAALDTRCPLPFCPDDQRPKVFPAGFPFDSLYSVYVTGRGRRLCDRRTFSPSEPVTVS